VSPVRESLGAVAVIERYVGSQNEEGAPRRASQSRRGALCAILDRLSVRGVSPGPVRCCDLLTVVSLSKDWRHRMSNQTPRQISVRLDPDLVATIERAAEQERRTVSNLVRNLIADWAAARAGGGGALSASV
jgi:hypothetical protein